MLQGRRQIFNEKYGRMHAYGYGFTWVFLIFRFHCTRLVHRL